MKLTEANYYSFLLAPLATEKSTGLASQNKYAFKVHKASTKTFLTKAVEHVFNVKVDSVNVVNVKGKQKVFKGRAGQKSAFKKAIFTLKQGHVIDLANIGA